MELFKTSNGGLLESSAVSELLAPATLPCGRVIPNRMAKAAMYEHMASLFGGPPNSGHLALYSTWAQGDWGMILTGNVQVSVNHLSLGRDIVVPKALTDTDIEPFKKLASVMRGAGSSRHCPPLAIMQLSHAGRQSANILGGRWPFVRPSGPSAVGLDLSKGSPGFISSLLSRLMFQTPKEMTDLELQQVIDEFSRGAILAHKSGFDGIELHAGHGYLLAQFISPESNQRTDAYSAMTAPLHLLQQVTSGIRRLVPKEFVLGVKLNAADYVQDKTMNEGRVLQHLRDIAGWETIDFIEVSGGTYERPDFMDHSDNKTSQRQALFSKFSQMALKELTAFQDANPHIKRPLVLLTGGFVSLDLMTTALRNHHADVLGIGRGSILHPHLPKLLVSNDTLTALSRGPLLTNDDWTLDPKLDQCPGSLGRRAVRTTLITVARRLAALPSWIKPRIPKLIGAGTEMAWYTVTMRHLPDIVEGNQANLPSYGLEAIVRMWLYVSPGPWQIQTWILVVLLAMAVVFST